MGNEIAMKKASTITRDLDLLNHISLIAATYTLRIFTPPKFYQIAYVSHDPPDLAGLYHALP